VARKVIEDVRAGKVETAIGFFDREELPENAQELLEGTTEMLSGTTEVDLINFGFFKSFKMDKLDEQFVYHAKGKSSAALVFVSVRTLDGASSLRGFRVSPAPIDLNGLYPFTLFGMAPLHYLVLLLCILVPVFILVTVVEIVRSSKRRKWLWVLFAVIGVGKFGVQWVVGGRWIFQPLFVQLFGVSVLKYPMYQPWVLTVSFPLGAVLFWLRSRRRPDNEQPLEEEGETEYQVGGDVTPLPDDSVGLTDRDLPPA